LFNFSENLKPLSKTEKSTNLIFEPVDEQVVNKPQPSSKTASKQENEQVVVPSINNTNNTNISNTENLDAHKEKIKEDLSDGNSEKIPKEKSAAKKEKVETPDLRDVLEYFRKRHFPETEANKYFNYFKSIGWLVGGKTQMVDWKAAANNWMLNAPKFISHERTDRTKYLDASTGKNYSEPL